MLRWASFWLTCLVKIGIIVFMFEGTLFFVLRLWLVTGLWIFVWWFLVPKTQLMRVFRAAVLVLGLLGALAVLRIAGQC